ncbi:MAG: ABC transporter substrate-binding protein [Planctomycetota bacterium]|nr:ABC transporter substrate-binding protein [Planctomycetota bacterium]
MRGRTLPLIALAVLLMAPWTAAEESTALPRYGAFETFTTRDGLPSDRVTTVFTHGGRVWAGTDRGLAVREDGRWRTLGVKDGLAHEHVTSITREPISGDLFVGTLGGLSRITANRIRTFTHRTSGLLNDVVHHVVATDGLVYAATAIGVSVHDVRAGTWGFFDPSTTSMREPFTQAVALAGERLWIGVGGDGLAVRAADGAWTSHRDPDGDAGSDAVADDGPIHDATTFVACDGDLIWQATPVGLSRFDGTSWRTWTAAEAGLPSDRIHHVVAQGGIAWLATDQGLGVFDGTTCVTYRPGAASTGPAHDEILWVHVDGDDLWLATGAGLSHARRTGNAESRAPAPAVKRELPERRFFTEPLRYRGPAGPELTATEVRIGLLLPAEGPDAGPGRDTLRGATLALEEANAHERWRAGLTFQLVTAEEAQDWSEGANAAVELVTRQEALVLLGAVSDDASHTVLRVLDKLRVALVNTIGTDPTLTTQGSPWLLRLGPDADEAARALARRLKQDRRGHVALRHSRDRFGRVGAAAFRRAAEAADLGLTESESQADAIVAWSRDAGGKTGKPLYGPGRLRTKGATVAWPVSEDPKAWRAFERAYRARFGEAPSLAAGYAHDAARMVIDAVRTGGRNRVQIRASLSAVRERKSVTGSLRLDTTLDRIVNMATRRVP